MFKSLLAIFLLIASFKLISADDDSLSPNRSSLSPMPTPEKPGTAKAMPPSNSGPISTQASSSGVSLPVRDLPAATPDVDHAPREINPQNSIRIKPQQTGSATKAVSKKPVRRHNQKQKR